jgi:hypothetical protein
VSKGEASSVVTLDLCELNYWQGTPRPRRNFVSARFTISSMKNSPLRHALALAVLASAGLLSGCNEQPPLDSEPNAPAQAPVAPAPVAGAPAAATAPSSPDTFKAKLPPLTLVGKPYEDARAKMQPLQPCEFTAEWIGSDGGNWQARGKTNGRLYFFTFTSSTKQYDGEWLVDASSALRRGANGFAQSGFQPPLREELLTALAHIPPSANQNERLQDDFAGGKAAAQFQRTVEGGTLRFWVDEIAAEVRKLVLQKPGGDTLTVEFSNIRTEVEIPRPPAYRLPW